MFNLSLVVLDRSGWVRCTTYEMGKTRVCRRKIGVRSANFQYVGKWADRADSRQRTRWNVLHESNFTTCGSWAKNSLVAADILCIDSCLMCSGCGQVTGISRFRQDASCATCCTFTTSFWRCLGAVLDVYDFAFVWGCKERVRYLWTVFVFGTAMLQNSFLLLFSKNHLLWTTCRPVSTSRWIRSTESSKFVTENIFACQGKFVAILFAPRLQKTPQNSRIFSETVKYLMEMFVYWLIFSSIGA